jgi:hypothetical protein
VSRAAALTRPCPKCGAIAGERCKGRNRYRIAMHRERHAPEGLREPRPSRSRSTRMREKGWVYFIGSRGTGAVKIGFSRHHPGSRLRALQTGNSADLYLAAFFAGDQAKERELHERFGEFHLRGEWFRHDGQLRDFISLLSVEEFA